MPQTISVNNSAFADYIKVASLSRNDRQIAFGKLSNEQKASFVKVQFAMQLVKRPNLTKEQRDFILEAISKVSVDLYDKENPEKVALADKLSQETEDKGFKIFARKDAFEILEGLGVSKAEDVALIQKYEELLKLGIQQRKNIVNEMPIAERAGIWKTQLAYHLATSTLTKEQKQFIAEIMPNIQSILETPSNLSKEEKEKYAEALESKAFKVFSKTEAYAVFMTIGIQNRVRDNLEASKQSNLGYKSQNFILAQAFRPNLYGILALSSSEDNKSSKSLNTLNQDNYCRCRTFCDLFGYSCATYGNSCIQGINNCGFFGDQPCLFACAPD